MPRVAGRFSDSETSWVLPGGAEGSFLCSLITDFLAEGAGWGASPGRGGELGCQAQQVLSPHATILSGASPWRHLQGSHFPSQAMTRESGNPRSGVHGQQRAGSDHADPRIDGILPAARLGYCRRVRGPRGFRRQGLMARNESQSISCHHLLREAEEIRLR